MLLNIPLRGEGEVVVSAFGEIALLESSAVGKRDVIESERANGIGMSEVAYDGLRVLAGIEQDVGHAAFLPAFIGSEMAALAGFGADVVAFAG